MTPSWYLNHSASPNVAADDALKFYAIRDIRAEEELTADYGSYSENESESEMS
jgi:SET domain-containing protein